MKTILNLIAQEKVKLDQHSFCQWMTKADMQTDALAFAPSMSYFVLGFRDILELVRFENPTSELEKAINHHCEEDSEHWKWFLQDLAELGYLNQPTQQFLTKIWSDRERTPRNMVYFLTHLVQTQKDPALILVIIECLEAAFAVFIERLRPQLVNRNLYHRLSYFGLKHDEGEQSHAMGSWIEDGEQNDSMSSAHHHEHGFDEDDLVLNEGQVIVAQQLVESVFGRFHQLFSHWHQEALSTSTVKVLPLNSLSGEATLL